MMTSLPLSKKILFTVGQCLKSPVCGASLHHHFLSVVAIGWQTRSFQSICLWSGQGLGFRGCNIKPKPFPWSGCRMVILESAGEHGTVGGSCVVSSGTDNGLGALLEHRRLCPHKYGHMGVHNLIIPQEFTQHLIFWCQGYHSEQHRHNPCLHEGHIPKEACF